MIVHRAALGGELSDPSDTGWIDGNANHPRHTVRHPEAEAQIAAAHAPPDAMEVAMQTGIDDALEEYRRRHADYLARGRAAAPNDEMFASGAAAQDPGPVFAVDVERPKEPSLVLTGEDLAAFEVFAQAASALEEHAEKQRALEVAYRAALGAISAMAARRNRGR